MDRWFWLVGRHGARPGARALCRWAEVLVTDCCVRQYRCHKRTDKPIYEHGRCNSSCPDYVELVGEAPWAAPAGPAARVPASGPQEGTPMVTVAPTASKGTDDGNPT